MQFIDVIPDGWTQDRADAFNEVVSAALGYMVYDNALSKLGVNDPTLNQIRTDMANLIKTLGQRLKATP